MNIAFLFPLDANGIYALGADSKTLILLKRRWFEAPELLSLDRDWHPLQRIGTTKNTVLDALAKRDIQLMKFAKAEFDDLPERFWEV